MEKQRNTHIYTNTSPRCGDVFDVMNLFGREEKKSLKLDAFRRVKTPLLTRTYTHTVCRQLVVAIEVFVVTESFQTRKSNSMCNVELRKRRQHVLVFTCSNDISFPSCIQLLNDSAFSRMLFFNNYIIANERFMSSQQNTRTHKTANNERHDSVLSV